MGKDRRKDLDDYDEEEEAKLLRKIEPPVKERNMDGDVQRDAYIQPVDPTEKEGTDDGCKTSKKSD